MKLKKKFIAVIGERNAGKSTIIRALTGCKSAVLPTTVEDNSTGGSIEVMMNSPEELNIDPKKIRKKIQDAIKRISSDRHSLGMVIALQPNDPTKRVSMEEVFEMTRGYPFLRYAFVISTPYNDDSRGTDLREIEERLKGFHVEEPVQAIDARRFAHVNASAIRDIVGWF